MSVLIEDVEPLYFYSLCKGREAKKKRGCLKCGKFFMSQHFGHRTCGSCAEQNAKAAVRAESVVEF